MNIIPPFSLNARDLIETYYSGCGVKNEPRKKQLKAQKEAEVYYSNSGKMTIPGRLSINVSV